MRYPQGFRVGSATLGLAIGTCLATPVFASSQLQHGNFQEVDPAGPSYHDQGSCNFVTGPRDGLAADRFVLTAGDDHAARDTELLLGGTFKAIDGGGGRTIYALTPDGAAAGKFVEDVLRRQSSDDTLSFLLSSLAVRVTERAGRAECSIAAAGMVTPAGGKPSSATLTFHGEGQYYAGSAAALAAAGPKPGAAGPIDNNPPCPTTLPADKALAPLGLDPVPGQCVPGTSCLLNFKGYQWWTSFQFYGPPGNPIFPYGGYYYNGGLQTIFAPRNAFVQADGLHLQVQTRDLGGGPVVAGSEVVLMFNPDGTQANLGYGDYLVTATETKAPDWNSLDPNVAFGLFPYERVGGGSTGDANNPAREIDLAELSTWGKYPPGNCPYRGIEAALCNGNAQFTLQIYNKDPLNLHRYTIPAGANTVTLVMRWRGQGKSVTFEQYNGAFTLATLPPKPDNSWTTPDDQSRLFVPAPGCGRFHMNLWLGNFPAATKQVNPPPAKLPQEVVVSNFEFRAAK